MTKLEAAHRAILAARKAVWDAVGECGWTYGLQDADGLLQDAATQVESDVLNERIGEEPRIIAYQV